MKREMEFLKQLRHPNIISVEEADPRIFTLYLEELPPSLNDRECEIKPSWADAKTVLFDISSGEWSFIISIKATVAVAITTARATLLAAISVCLSQEKWTRFTKRTHRLQDFAIIDTASRGPLGSLQMLYIKFHGDLLALVRWLLSYPYSQIYLCKLCWRRKVAYMIRRVM
ncbi:hypothetical protein V8C34DRAFT_290498 [Trichoderma compactum]